MNFIDTTEQPDIMDMFENDNSKTGHPAWHIDRGDGYPACEFYAEFKGEKATRYIFELIKKDKLKT